MIKNRPRVAVAAIGALLSLVLGSLAVPTAQAAEPGEKTVEQHCGTLVETGQSVCVPLGTDLNAEILRVTGVRIIDPSDPNSASKAEVGVKASYLIVRFFKNGNYTGDQWDYFFTSTCTSGGSVKEVDWMGSWIPASNDSADSFQGYSNCRVEVYEDINFGGAMLPYASVRPTFGTALHDRVSSFRAKY